MNRRAEIQTFDESLAGLASDYFGGAFERLGPEDETEVDLAAHRLATTLYARPDATDRALVWTAFGMVRFGAKRAGAALLYLALRTDAHLRALSGGGFTLGHAVIGKGPERPS